AGKHAESGFQAAIAERPAALIVIHAVNLARQFGHDNIWSSVVVIVLENDSHAGEPSAVLRQGGPRFQAAFGEGAIPIVMEQILLHAVVCHKDVEEPVLVIVSESHAQSAP